MGSAGVQISRHSLGFVYYLVHSEMIHFDSLLEAKGICAMMSCVCMRVCDALLVNTISQKE